MPPSGQTSEVKLAEHNRRLELEISYVGLLGEDLWSNMFIPVVCLFYCFGIGKGMEQLLLAFTKLPLQD